MNSFNLQSHKTQLVLTALTASLATIGVLSAYTSYTKRARRRNLNSDILRSIASGAATDNVASEQEKIINAVNQPDHPLANGKLGYDEELIREQLARNYAFFGEEGMAKIRNGSVVIVGCGGVGSWAAVMLVRSCVQSLIPSFVF